MRSTEKFYEMTREEMWINHMQAARRAFELDKKKWFLDHHPSLPRFSDGRLGQSCMTLNQTMFLLAIQNMCNDK